MTDKFEAAVKEFEDAINAIGWVGHHPEAHDQLDAARAVLIAAHEQAAKEAAEEWQSTMTPIPISAARHIAMTYAYDQVVIVARKVGDNGGEHVTTYGRDAENCDVAAKIGDYFKYKLMGWLPPPPTSGSAS